MRPPPPPPTTRAGPGLGPEAAALARDAFGREIEPDPAAETNPAPPAGGGRRELATEALGRRAGALADELDFPEFVASLVHGTFDAIVDSSIRQMETFADLVAAVAKPLDQFMAENVTANQARDHLMERYPADLRLLQADGGPRLAPAAGPQGNDGAEEAAGPPWLADFGLEGEQLTAELLEERLVPLAREAVARQRLQTLSSMVLLGMNRVVVRDGTINARLRFRAAAADRTAFDYATGSEPQTGVTEWGRRGSRATPLAVTKVATVGMNVQADSELKAELTGEVRINFASETLPLDRLPDEARRGLLERNSRPTPPATPPRRGVAP